MVKIVSSNTFTKQPKFPDLHSDILTIGAPVIMKDSDKINKNAMSECQGSSISMYPSNGRGIGFFAAVQTNQLGRLAKHNYRLGISI